MQLEERSIGNVRVLSVLQPRLDVRSAADFKQAIADMVARDQGAIVIDLGKVAFIDSTGLGAIVSALKLIGRDGELAIADLTESVATLFKLTRMDKVFRSFPTVDAAVTGLSK